MFTMGYKFRFVLVFKGLTLSPYQCDILTPHTLWPCRWGQNVPPKAGTPVKVQCHNPEYQNQDTHWHENLKSYSHHIHRSLPFQLKILKTFMCRIYFKTNPIICLDLRIGLLRWKGCMYKFYRPMWPYAGLRKVLVNGLACHMHVCVDI